MFFAPALLAFTLLQAELDPTLPPGGTTMLYTVEGRGVQIYRCTSLNSGYLSGIAQWIFQSPEASLFDPATHRQVGTHGAGPSWTWNDGSSITGKLLQKRISEDAASIPWLLLETHVAGAIKGALSGVAFVRRSDTRGGNAPATGCDTQHRETMLRVPYEATYTFYTMSSR